MQGKRQNISIWFEYKYTSLIKIDRDFKFLAHPAYKCASKEAFICKPLHLLYNMSL